MLGRLLSLVQIGYLYLTGRKIGVKEYARDYDRISGTYGSWTDVMGIHTLALLEEKDLRRLSEKQDGALVIDLAAGSGIITRELLRRTTAAVRVTAVDISRGMLDKLCGELDDEGRARINVIEADAHQFLDSLTENSVDAVYCGWGMIYLDHDRIVRLLSKILKKGGKAGFIMNRAGSVHGLEKAVLRVMEQDPSNVALIQDIRYGMPADSVRFERWFTARGFETARLSSGEVERSFDSVDELFIWLTGSGVLAGTRLIFHDWGKASDQLKREMSSIFYRNGKYRIDHKFVSGIFNKK